MLRSIVAGAGLAVLATVALAVEGGAPESHAYDNQGSLLVFAASPAAQTLANPHAGSCAVDCVSFDSAQAGARYACEDSAGRGLIGSAFSHDLLIPANLVPVEGAQFEYGLGAVSGVVRFLPFEVAVPAVFITDDGVSVSTGPGVITCTFG